jgi:hypothetical protein
VGIRVKVLSWKNTTFRVSHTSRIAATVTSSSSRRFTPCITVPIDPDNGSTSSFTS